MALTARKTTTRTHARGKRAPFWGNTVNNAENQPA